MISQELKEILEILPIRELKNLAKKQDLSTTGNRMDIIKRLETELEDIDIMEVWEQYQDAGDVSIHFAVMDDGVFDEFSNNPEMYFEQIGLKKFFNKDIKITDLTITPTLLKINKRKNNGFILYFIFRGKSTEFYLENKFEGVSRIQNGYIRGTASVILIPNHRLIQFRGRERRIVKSIYNQIKDWFPESELVSFTKEHAKFWINEETSKLSNIRFKLVGENLSSISLTAPKHGDLKQEEEELEKNWERGSCSGFYISADVSIEEKSRQLGLLFNIKQGKIYFKSYSSESDIKFVIERLIECLGL